MKDVDNNYYFDPFYDKIGFIDSLITLPKDSIIDLKLFKEETDLIWDKPHFINSEKIGFGYYGKLDFSRLVIDSNLPDSVDYIFTKSFPKIFEIFQNGPLSRGVFKEFIFSKIA